MSEDDRDFWRSMAICSAALSPGLDALAWTRRFLIGGGRTTDGCLHGGRRASGAISKTDKPPGRQTNFTSLIGTH
jgi:hypothetical protein